MALRRIPQEELERFAHEEYLRRYANVPAPVVLNVEAVLTFSESREFVWDGVVCRAPPLPYLLGFRLLVAAQALRDLRQANAEPSTRIEAVRMASWLIRAAIRPVSLFHRLGRRFRRSLLHGRPEEIEGLCFWLIDCPDQGVNPPPTKRVTVDFMDVLAGFAREFPAWCHDHASARRANRRDHALGWHRPGMPISWAHYNYGNRHAGRQAHRHDLRLAVAMRAAQSNDKGWSSFENEWLPATGWGS